MAAPLAHTRTGSGAPALFIHGFPLSRTMWDGVLPALTPLADCIVPDLRGFGRTPGAGEAVLTMERHADDLVELLDHLAVPRAHVVALSMGGYVALALADRHPHRLSSLTLVDTKSTDDGAEGRKGREAAADRLLEVGRARFAADMLPKLVAPTAGRAVRARILSMIEATPYETIVAALLGMRDRPDRTHVLRSLNVPLTVICGELDALTPPDLSRAMAAARPGARLELIPGAGHMAPMEEPAACAEVLRDVVTAG
jgi:3-oxoadipate enol-lactonase